VSDPVGYGFVIRGEGPVFIKAVDPMGPAAAAGLKVCTRLILCIKAACCQWTKILFYLHALGILKLVNHLAHENLKGSLYLALVWD
jgi:predicted metalloprotease with PDZ domain